MMTISPEQAVAKIPDGASLMIGGFMAVGSSPVMDTISTVMPIGLAISPTTGLVTGKPSFVGETQAETKVTHPANGQLLPPLSIVASAASQLPERSIRGMMSTP